MLDFALVFQEAWAMCLSCCLWASGLFMDIMNRYKAFGVVFTVIMLRIALNRLFGKYGSVGQSDSVKPIKGQKFFRPNRG